jgi:hypothetical protein
MPIAKLKYMVTNGNLATGNFEHCPRQYNTQLNDIIFKINTQKKKSFQLYGLHNRTL